MEWGLIQNTASRIQLLQKFGISSFLQPLQFDICIQFLELFWYFVYPLVSAIWYMHLVSAIISVFYQEDICLISAIFVQFLQFGILFSTAFAFWFSVTVDYGYWKRWFALVYECEVGWENYSYWSYVMRNFLKGKKMWGYVSGTYMIPKNIKEGDVLIDTWKANNAKIIPCINNFIEHSIGT